MCLSEVVDLQDGGVRAALAGPDVADHPVFTQGFLIETCAASLRSSTTQTYQHTQWTDQNNCTGAHTSLACFFFPPI